VGVQVHIQAIDHPDAFHDAAMLAAHPFNFGRMAFVEDSIVEYQAGIPAPSHAVADGRPDGNGRDIFLYCRFYA